MKLTRLLAILLILAGTAQAQPSKLSSADKTLLTAYDDSLKLLSQKMVFSENPAERFRADSSFVRVLMRALKTPYSYYFPFDSMNVAKLYSPDSAFRIFTWQLKKDEYVLIQKGVIQMNTKDGALVRHPLFDYSMYTPRPLDSVRTAKNWIGAIYYKAVVKEHKGKKYYTLLGFDDFTVNSNKKWMEVMHFDETGQPVFGGPFISFKEDSIKKPTQFRYSVEYKKEAKTYFNYDPDLDLIIVDHLISESDEPEKKFTYVPDGDYEAFKWKEGQWVHVDKIFNQKLKDGEFPQESLLYDENGNADESKLEEHSNKNTNKKGTTNPQPVKKTTPTPAPVPPKKKTGGGAQK